MLIHVYFYLCKILNDMTNVKTMSYFLNCTKLNAGNSRYMFYFVFIRLRIKTYAFANDCFLIIVMQV